MISVSVLVPTYNHGSFIERALRSVLSQDCNAHLEVLVGVDKSGDDTLGIVEGIRAQDSRIRCIAHDPRLGYGSKNLHVLLEMARGNFITHLDGDDYWLPGKLQQQLEFLEAYPQVDAVYSNAIVVGPDGRTLGVFTSPKQTIFDAGYLLQQGNFIPHCTLMYRSSMRSRLLALEAPFLDYEVHASILSGGGKAGFINETLAGYTFDSPGSVRKSMNALIWDLHWRATCSLIDDVSGRLARTVGAAEFLTSVLIASFRSGDWALWSKYWNSNALAGRVRRGLLLPALVMTTMRRIAKSSANAVLSRFSPASKRTFYGR